MKTTWRNSIKLLRLGPYGALQVSLGPCGAHQTRGFLLTGTDLSSPKMPRAEKMFIVNGFTSTEVSLLMTVYVFENWRRLSWTVENVEKASGNVEKPATTLSVWELVRDLRDNFSRTWHFVFSRDTEKQACTQQESETRNETEKEDLFSKRWDWSDREEVLENY